MRKRNRHLLFDPLAIYYGINLGIPLLILIVFGFKELIDNYPIISSIVTLAAVCCFGLLWFKRKISKQ